MKIIVSHDVDYITVWEHKDLSVPKFILRTLIESSYAKTIGTREIIHRIKEFFKNRWHNLPEIVQFDKDNGIPSTFFFGMNKGLGLCYDLKTAQKWVDYVLSNGFDVGLHLINFDSLPQIMEEKKLFQKFTGLKEFGVRIHYLRKASKTLEYLSEAGFLFDSSEYILKAPFKVGNMWEFPITLMDTYLFNDHKFWQVIKFEEAKKLTKDILRENIKRKIKYFVLLFHDNRFSDSYKDAMDWYKWVVEFLKNEKFEFVSFKNAIEDLKNE